MIKKPNLARIAILGDSWGVPDHDISKRENPTLEHTHIEYMLKSLGHVVTNFSRNGGCNSETLDNLNLAYDLGCEFDLVIWFHTELLREYDFKETLPSEYKINELIDLVSDKVYQYAQYTKNRQKALWLVIGGQAPLHESYFKYPVHDFIISDWRSEIVGKKLPEIHSLARLHLVDNTRCIDTLEQKSKIVEHHYEIFHAMKDSMIDGRHLFPDYCHPGEDAHNKLTIMVLHDIIEKYINTNIYKDNT